MLLSKPPGAVHSYTAWIISFDLLLRRATTFLNPKYGANRSSKFSSNAARYTDELWVFYSAN